MSHPQVLAEPGSKVVMLGNVAIARAALEHGIGFASAYPGTPSTEIVEALAYASRKLGAPYVEWSSNEKVALEAALGAALAGVSSLAAMKHVGMNVAADPLFSSAYTGVRASMVVVSADDPGMHSSQNEQDNRWYGVHAYIPVVEPAGAQEAYDAVKEAFRISEKFEHPVIVRTTTRIGHTRVPVRVGEIDVARLHTKGKFPREPERTALVPAHARRLREWLVDKWSRIEDHLVESGLNTVEGPEDAEVLVVGVGLGYHYAKEALEEIGHEEAARLLKLQTTVPLPRELLVREASQRSLVLVVEDGEPVVETLLKAVLHEDGVRVRVWGKNTGHMPLTGELTLDKVMPAIAKALGAEPPDMEPVSVSLELPPRPPVLCPGCPYRSVFYALRKAISQARVKPVFSGDIGCYSLGVLPPFRMQDTIIDMGASIGLGSGLSHVLEDQMVIAIIGDSTFFHSGLPALANAVFNRSPMLIIVLDNRTTAMTGHQPHPGIGLTARGSLSMELRPTEIARAMGVGYVAVTDAFDAKGQVHVFKEAIQYVKEKRAPALIVARGACILVAGREARKQKVEAPVYTVDWDKCTGCGVCYKAFNCPAIVPTENKKPIVDPVLCTGCGECADICPFDAFEPTAPVPTEWKRIMRDAKPEL